MRAAIHRLAARLVAAAALACLLAACGTAGPPTPTPTGVPTATPTDASAATPVTDPTGPPSGATTTPTTGPTEEPDGSPAPSSATTQSDTEWGRIWDAVPPGYPRYPGSTSADDAGPDPVSLAYALAGTDAETVATWMQTAMETATYSTEALSGPLEDGQFVLDSVGDDGCRIETTMAPQGGLILVTVRYGAACPAP